MTSFQTIYDLALSLIDDPLLAQWPEEDLTNELHGFMIKAIYSLPKLRSELSNRDEENEQFNTDLSDVTKMALVLGMKKQWLGPQIASITLTLQRSSKKESYSQSEMLKTLQSLYDSIDVELKRLLRDDSYIDNDYFDE